MQLKKLSIALLAGTALLAAAPAYSDDDDDDRYKYRHHRNKKKPKKEVHHHHYYYLSREAAIGERPAPPPAAQKPAAKGPGSFPKESAAERALGKERQREILEKELAAEQQLLAKAKTELAEQAMHWSEKRDSAILERVQPYKDNVELHERNIEALKRELNQR